ncbi:MAG: hypothetical protein AAFV95_21015 [Bacteroidota bacterium]
MKYHKTVLLMIVIGLLLHPITSWGQKNLNFHRGTITLQSQESLSGLVQDVTSIKKKRTSIYLIKEGGQKMEIDLSDVQAIQYDDGIQYRRIQGKEEAVLTQVLVEGRQSLFFRQDGKVTSFYLSSKEKLVVASEDREKEAEERFQVFERNFPEKDADFEKCNDLLKGYKVQERFLRQKVTKTNDCLQAKVTNLPSRRIREEFAILGGRLLGDIIETTSYPLAWGIAYNRLLPRGKFSVMTKFNTVFNAEVEGDVFLSLVGGLRYKFVHGPIEPFVYFTSGLFYEEEVFIRERKINANGFELGAGLDISLGERLALRTEWNGGILSYVSLGIVYRNSRLKTPGYAKRANKRQKG